jgi:hypothetical protein
MLGKLISSATGGIGGGGTLAEVYADTTADNYGIGENLTFHADANGNIAIGADAVNSITGHGDHNIGIGTSALTALTTADGTVAVGSSALAALTTGAKNVAIGYQALLLNIEGDNNIAIGYQSMNAMVGETGEANVGNDNIALGTDSMGSVNAGGNSSATSNNNIAIGSNALLGGTFTGTEVLTGNVAIGYHALDATGANAQTGTIAIGYGALTELTGAGGTGDGNVAIGFGSMDAITTGRKNVCVGYGTMGDAANDATASDNVFIGYSAGSGTWAGGGVDANIGIGTQALTGAMNDANHNIGIGYDSLATNVSGDKNIAIGFKADVDVNSDSYQVRIGHYGALRYMAARLDMSGDKEGSFTNAGIDNRPATGALLKIPQYGFLKRVTCTVETASGGTGIYNISLGNTSVAAGTVLDTQLELIGVGAADGNGTTSRTQAADTASDTNLDIVTAKYVHIWEASQATDASAGWADVDKFLYVCHADTGNAENAQDAVIRITAEYFGED